jgi:mRNA interferase RelE/StbE
VRQRVKHAIDALADNPRPPHSSQLDVAEPEAPRREVRRLRIDNWRVVYLVSDEEKTVDVVAVRKRPPYDYGDLAQLLGRQL